MDTCVRKGLFEEALQLQAYVQRLGKKHGDIPIIQVDIVILHMLGDVKVYHLSVVENAGVSNGSVDTDDLDDDDDGLADEQREENKVPMLTNMMTMMATVLLRKTKVILQLLLASCKPRKYLTILPAATGRRGSDVYETNVDLTTAPAPSKRPVASLYSCYRVCYSFVLMLCLLFCYCSFCSLFVCTC